ncbi:RNA binding protein [Oryctes borbonicus]|uniref:RNA binding protein n=1 Tax=Oryctes borbonicus TaxID=1629725 RepID=A0A0T6AZV8_9SCAR|nr:RNA binding protein [Oryctes borbonicus]
MSRYREWDLSCKVYVGNLGSSASKHEIESAFCKYGPLRNVWVARNPPGFAFVEFEDPRDAEDAVRGLDGTRCCGTRVRVEMSNGRSRRGGGRRGPPRFSRAAPLLLLTLPDRALHPLLPATHLIILHRHTYQLQQQQLLLLQLALLLLLHLPP